MDARARGSSRDGTGSPLELSLELSPTDYISGSSCARSGNSTYYSFPSPLSGRSPTLPSFHVPKYGYYNIEGGTQQRVQSPSGVPITHATTAQSSICYAFVQSINFFIGIGVLALPFALRMTGWFGLVLLVLFCALMAYSGTLFGKNRTKFMLENFSDHIEFSMSITGRAVVSLVFYATLLLNTALFLKLLADTTALATHLQNDAALVIATLIFITVANTCTSSASPVIRSVSLVGTVSTVCLLAALVYAELSAVLERLQDSDVGDAATEEGQDPGEVLARLRMLSVQADYLLDQRVYWTDLVACLKTLGIFGYCYMGHEVFPSIFHNMKHPSRYRAVVCLTFGTMLISYAAIAVLGYLAFGNRSQGNILDNLPRGSIITVVVEVYVLVTTLTKLCLASAPLTEGLREWLQLLGYLVRRSQYITGLIGQPARAMPRLRVTATPAHTTPAKCTRSTAQRSTYGTWPSSSHSASGGKQRIAQWNLGDTPQRAKYFGFPRDASAGDKEETKEELPPMEAEHTSHAARRLSFSLQPAPASPATPATAGTSSAKRHSLTWSDTIPIPPIRSPSCENLPLAGSVGSHDIRGEGRSMLGNMGVGTWGTALFGPECDGTAERIIGTVEEGPVEEDEEGSSIRSSEFSAADSLLAEMEAPTAPAPERALIYNDFHRHHHHHHHADNDAANRAEFPAESPTSSSYANILPIVMRTCVPVLAAALSLQFRSFAGMVVCIGGVCGGAVSIVIPCLAYYSIHYQEMCAAERCVVAGTAVLGAVLAVSTLGVFLV